GEVSSPGEPDSRPSDLASDAVTSAPEGVAAEGVAPDGVAPAAGGSGSGSLPAESGPVGGALEVPRRLTPIADPQAAAPDGLDNAGAGDSTTAGASQPVPSSSPSSPADARPVAPGFSTPPSPTKPKIGDTRPAPPTAGVPPARRDASSQLTGDSTATPS